MLVVDDDVDFRDSMIEILAAFGLRAVGVADGAEALAHLAQAAPAPALVLLDLMMPRMDGFQFREEQLKVPAWAEIPVVVLTAQPRPAATYSHFGAAAYLMKPVGVATVMAAVRRALGEPSP